MLLRTTADSRRLYADSRRIWNRTWAGHFCLPLHVAMQDGLYIHPDFYIRRSACSLWRFYNTQWKGRNSCSPKKANELFDFRVPGFSMKNELVPHPKFSIAHWDHIRETQNWFIFTFFIFHFSFFPSLDTVISCWLSALQDFHLGVRLPSTWRYSDFPAYSWFLPHHFWIIEISIYKSGGGPSKFICFEVDKTSGGAIVSKHNSAIPRPRKSASSLRKSALWRIAPH